MTYLEAIYSENIKYALWIIGLIIAVLFFTFAPLMTMILSGTFIVLVSVYYSTSGNTVTLYAFYLGAGILVLGIAGVYIPMVANNINTAQVYIQGLPIVKQLILVS